VYDKLDTTPIQILEFCASTTYIFDIHIYRGKIVGLRYPTLRSTEGKQLHRPLFFLAMRLDNVTARDAIVIVFSETWKE